MFILYFFKIPVPNFSTSLNLYTDVNNMWMICEYCLNRKYVVKILYVAKKNLSAEKTQKGQDSRFFVPFPQTRRKKHLEKEAQERPQEIIRLANGSKPSESSVERQGTA